MGSRGGQQGKGRGVKEGRGGKVGRGGKSGRNRRWNKLCILY